MDVDAARQAAGLESLAKVIGDATPEEPKKERGHGRSGKPVLHERPGQHPELRGIPLIGTGPGVISGTRPGDSARALEQAGRDILHAHLKRNRYRKQP